ncbi:hypothetical protein D3C73_1070430 [compost metagenome]
MAIKTPFVSTTANAGRVLCTNNAVNTVSSNTVGREGVKLKSALNFSNLVFIRFAVSLFRLLLTIMTCMLSVKRFCIHSIFGMPSIQLGQPVDQKSNKISFPFRSANLIVFFFPLK